ncbi:MAG: class I SAM-dependent methyltransferase [Actinobacteria bacterium]|nr:class I SAM-dependent methyltransferase [Actinomycetota bacterium]
MKPWDGVAYDALPLPHEQWGIRTIEALNLQPNETLLDAGCGTGRDAQLALEKLPHGSLVCVDQSSTMLDQCRTRFGQDQRVRILEGDLDQALPVEPESVDAIMSVAALHWLTQHNNVWQHFYNALKLGGRIATDCGGFGNLAKTLGLVPQIDSNIKFPDWYYANVSDTEALLKAAGFVDIAVSLRPHPTPLPDKQTLATYLKTLVFREWTEDQIFKMSELLTDNTLDYVRLEVRAKKA